MPKTDDTACSVSTSYGNHFRMALAATDEQWQSGTFRIEDDGSISMTRHLWAS